MIERSVWSEERFWLTHLRWLSKGKSPTHHVGFDQIGVSSRWTEPDSKIASGQINGIFRCFYHGAHGRFAFCTYFIWDAIWLNFIFVFNFIWMCWVTRTSKPMCLLTLTMHTTNYSFWIEEIIVQKISYAEQGAYNPWVVEYCPWESYCIQFLRSFPSWKSSRKYRTYRCTYWKTTYVKCKVYNG